MLVCQETKKGISHNKFWNAEHVDDFVIKVSWGRIGTKGQSKEHKFSSKYQSDAFAAKKSAEKRHKGYQDIDDRRFSLLKAQASVLGTRSKIYDSKWVECVPTISVMKPKGNHAFKELTDQDLLDPQRKPQLYLRADIARGKEYTEYEFLIGVEGVDRIETCVQASGHTFYDPRDVDEKDADVKKVMEALKQGI